VPNTLLKNVKLEEDGASEKYTVFRETQTAAGVEG
jgi:hypothetical protein